MPRSDTPQKGRLVDLSGGMVDVVHPALLNDNESKMLKNGSLDEKGTLEPCLGRKERFGAPFDAVNPCNGIAAFYPDTATSRLVIGAGSKLYKDNPHLMYRWDGQTDYEESGSYRNNVDTSSTPGDIKIASTKPADPTFTRASLAYDSQGRCTGIGTTNLLSANQSSIETDTTGVAANGSGTTIARDTTTYKFGTACLKVVTAASIGHGFITSTYTTATPGQAYTGSIYLKGSGTVTLRLQELNSGTLVRYTESSAIVLTGEWQRVSVSAVIGSGVNQVNLYVQQTTAVINTFYADGLQIEKLPYVTDWVLGGTTRADANNIPRIETSGVLIEEASPNILSANQSSVETDLTGLNKNTASDTMTRDTSEHWNGSASLKMVSVEAIGGLYITLEATAGVTYTFSVYLKGTGTLTLALTGAVAPSVGNSGIVLNSTWTRYTVTGTTSSAGLLYLYILNTSPTATWYVDGLQLEQKPYATSWTPGGSTRAAEALTIPANISNTAKWTKEVEFVASSNGTVGGQPTIWGAYVDAANYVGLWHDVTNQRLLFECQIGGAGLKRIASADNSLVKGQTYRATVSYDGVNFTLYLAGALVGTIASSSLNITQFTLGSFNAALHCNEYIKAVRTSNIDRTLAEHQAWNASGTLPNDEYTSYLLSIGASALTVADIVAGCLHSATKDISAAIATNSGKVEFTAATPGASTVSFFTRTSADGATWDDWSVVDGVGNIQSVYRRYIQVKAKLTISGTDKPSVQEIKLSYDGTPAASELASGFTAGSQFYFATLLSKLIMTNKLDNPKKWDGTAAIADLGGSPPKGQYVATHKNFLFMAHSSASPNRLFFSEVLNIDSWPALNFIDVSPNDGDWITGLLSHDDYLIITKNRSIWVLVGTGTSDFEVRRLHAGVGCVSPRSLVRMGEVFAFASYDGIYVSDLSQPVLITERIKNTWKGLNQRRLNQVCAAYYDHKLRMDAPNGSSVINNLRIIYDGIRKAMYLQQFTDHASCYTDFIEAGQQVLLYGHSNEGQVSEVDLGTTDSGQAILFEWEGKHFDFGLPEHIKRFRQVWMEFAPAASDTTVNIQFIVDGGLPSAAIPVVVPGDSTKKVHTVRLLPSQVGVVQGHSLGFRVTQSTVNGGVGIHAIIVDYFVKGARPTI